MLNTFSGFCWLFVISSLENYLIRSFARLLIELLFLLLSYRSSLYILDFKHLSDMQFSFVMYVDFHFVDCFFCYSELFSLIQFYLFIFYLVACALEVKPKKSLLRLMSRSFSLFFSPKEFYGFWEFCDLWYSILRSLIHFKFIFVSSVRQGSNFTLLHVNIQFLVSQKYFYQFF